MEKFFLIVLLAFLVSVITSATAIIGFLFFLISPWLLGGYIVFCLLFFLWCLATANCDSIEG